MVTSDLFDEHLTQSYPSQILLIANRGEIAVRIIRSALRLGISTIAIYTPSDALAPHVPLATKAIELSVRYSEAGESNAYQDVEQIIKICEMNNVTLVHPGYGFLSESAFFALALQKAGIKLVGPSVENIRIMGVKHEAKIIARESGVPIVGGSEGLVNSFEEAVGAVRRLAEREPDGAYPVIVKATAGGGGMGMAVCWNEEELKGRFEETQSRAGTLFGDNGLFIEKYIGSARHIEIQVFGNGLGEVIHMYERECSVQRRHQKVIEEAPSPFLADRPGLRDEIVFAALRLCEKINYSSAGTCEFVVDNQTGSFYFLELNTRLQVEHAVTEQRFPGLDIVELMLKQAVAERTAPFGQRGLPKEFLQSHVDSYLLTQSGHNPIHAIEARVYCENPSAGFKPSPGILQHVEFPTQEWLRIESWVESGTTITPNFDPLICKLVVQGSSRQEAVQRLLQALSETEIFGPPTNISYLLAIVNSRSFADGGCDTKFLDHFPFTPHVLDILAGGLETTIQDFPGRLVGCGLPRSGPMDYLAFQAANLLVGNNPEVEGLEILIPAPQPKFKLYFHVSAVVAVAGADAEVTINGKIAPTWSRLMIQAGSKFEVGGVIGGGGLRAYLCIRGGFPEIPKYLDSKSTSMGLGGYQGRALKAGDQITLGDCKPLENDVPLLLPKSMLPSYPSNVTVYVLSGPHEDTEFITPEGIEDFYSHPWRIAVSSNRMGIRLEHPSSHQSIRWARKTGGEGGSHPSNIHDNAYALGSININGDTPVLLTNEGPDMGGYLCFATVASADLWKLGQFRPGSMVKFQRISIQDAIFYSKRIMDWINVVLGLASGFSPRPFLPDTLLNVSQAKPSGSKLQTIPRDKKRPQVVFRQAGDSAILIEYGPLLLDFSIRARIHALQMEAQSRAINGIISFSPCIRSTMCRYDSEEITQDELLAILVEIEESLPDDVESMEFPGRRITFPIVLDDSWNREALKQYTRTIRDKAVYLPSNIQYLAENNGLQSENEALQLLVSSDWLVFGIGFYLACPFLVPIDPRCRLVGQKMNPSRTFTPQGAIGIAGLVAAIYPVESPGGYQLYGRTLPAWQTWGRGFNFSLNKPWLLEPFDQVHFEPVSEAEYLQIEKGFYAGSYKFKIEPVTFSMKEYTRFTASIRDEIAEFKLRQAKGVAKEEEREAALLQEWVQSKNRISLHDDAETENQIQYSSMEDGDAGLSCVVSSLDGNVWKMKVAIGEVITSPDQVVVVLEAMKTEINVEAGDENVGLRVVRFGYAVKEGATVKAGDPLVLFGINT